MPSDQPLAGVRHVLREAYSLDDATDRCLLPHLDCRALRADPSRATATFQHRPSGALFWVALLTLLIVPMLTAQPASAQKERMEDIRDSTKPEDIAIREKVSDLLKYGFSESEEHEWKVWQHDHPGGTTDDFKEYWSKIEVAAQELQQLSANKAGGWAFIAPSSSGRPVIVNSGGSDKPTKFVLASLRIPEILQLTDSINPSTTRRNVIRIRESEDPWQPLPSKFFEVNDKFLADMQSLNDTDTVMS